MLIKCKKGLGTIVAIALLLIAVIVSVFVFSDWFESHIAKMTSDFETGDGSFSELEIDSIVGNDLYIRNSYSNLEITNVKVGSNDCQITNNDSTELITIDIGSCITGQDLDVAKVVVYTNKGVLDDKILLTGEVSSLSNVGSECRFKDNMSGCEQYYIEDTVDGIEVIHDQVHGLYWQGNASSYLSFNGSIINWADAKTYCEGLAGGSQGWRLPTLVEMEESLVDVSQSSNPYVVGGETLFKDLNSSTYYWTSTRYSNSESFTMDFYTGHSYYSPSTQDKQVLCVNNNTNEYQDTFRNTQTYVYGSGLGQRRLTNEFILNVNKCGGSYTIYDNVTDLCWTMNATTSTYNWGNAVNYCDTLNVAGGNWRLPEKKEIMTLLYNNGVGTTDDQLSSIGFNNVDQVNYWSNSEGPFASTGYLVMFYQGYSYSNLMILSYYVLCAKDPTS